MEKCARDEWYRQWELADMSWSDTSEVNDDLYKLQGCSEKVVIQRAARG